MKVLLETLVILFTSVLVILAAVMVVFVLVHGLPG